jgi:hypothetical protein
MARVGGKRTLPLDRGKVGNSRIPSVHEIRVKYRKGSAAAERTADAVPEANKDEAARAEWRGVGWPSERAVDFGTGKRAMDSVSRRQPKVIRSFQVSGAEVN